MHSQNHRKCICKLQNHDKRSFAGVKHSTKAFLRMTLDKKHCMQGSRKSKLKEDLTLEHCAIISMLCHRIYRNSFFICRAGQLTLSLNGQCC